MRYVKQNVGSEDTVQLFTSAGVAVPGVLFGEVIVEIRKAGASGWSAKAITGSNWTDRGAGNYALKFENADFDTLGIFQYKIRPNGPSFQTYQDSLYVVTTLPTVLPAPPTINSQTDSSPGILPNPVYKKTAPNTLTITGTELLNPTAVTVGGVALSVTANTDTSIAVTVIDAVPLGTDVEVIVVTAGGTAKGKVNVVVHPDDIPGELCEIHGKVFSTKLGQPLSGVAVFAILLDMPVIVDGVAWTDETIPVSTDAQGVFSVKLPRQKRVEIFIPRTQYRREFVVPNVAKADLFTEIP